MGMSQRSHLPLFNWKGSQSLQSTPTFKLSPALTRCWKFAWSDQPNCSLSLCHSQIPAQMTHYFCHDSHLAILSWVLYGSTLLFFWNVHLCICMVVSHRFWINVLFPDTKYIQLSVNKDNKVSEEISYFTFPCYIKRKKKKATTTC